MPPKISEFQGQWRFLSNFWPCNVMYNMHMFPSSEHAYVAAKVHIPGLYKDIASYNPGQTKRFGKLYDWGNRDKRLIMLNIVHDKFTRNPALGKALLATGDAILEEGNLWHDRYWGISPPNSGQGQNHLGKILMQVREELRT